VGQREALQKQKKQFEEQTEEHKQEAETCGKSAMILIELHKALSVASEAKTEALLSLGLNTTFTDQPSFKAVLESTRRRGINNLDLSVEIGGHKHDPEDLGGGINAVISLLMQSIVIKRAGLAPILFIDERLNHVSPQYRTEILKLLRNLCDKSGMEIVMTTNEEDFVFDDQGKQVPDLVLEVSLDRDKLVVKEEKRKVA